VSSDHLLSSDFKSPTVKIGTGSMTDDPFSTARCAVEQTAALFIQSTRTFAVHHPLVMRDVVCGHPSCSEALLELLAHAPAIDFVQAFHGLNSLLFTPISRKELDFCLANRQTRIGTL
jgi:hypothetical protein